jgi:hypothetical protein
MLNLHRPPVKLLYHFASGLEWTLLMVELFDPISIKVLRQLLTLYGPATITEPSLRGIR